MTGGPFLWSTLGGVEPMTVRRNEARGRYELVNTSHQGDASTSGGCDDDVLGFADYRVEGRRAVFPHTVIDPGRRGQGLGDVLVAGALDDVRALGLTVVPQCWFVDQFLDQHPEYADLRAS